MAEVRKLAAILVSDVVGYSRLASADEDRVLARLRALRSDLIDPTIAVHKGRIVKRTGDGAIVEFRSVVEAVRCAIEIQIAMVERNIGIAEDRQIVFRIGIHLGDVVEESDGDLMGDGVNIAARLEGVAKPGAICLSEDAYRQVKSRLDLAVTDLGETKLKNIAEPIRAYSLQVGVAADPKLAKTAAALSEKPSIAALPFQNMSGDPEQEYFADGIVEDILTGLARVKSLAVIARNSSFVYKGKAVDIRQVGRELGARYVLEGSVRKGGEQLRLTAQLIEAETGAHLWAERFDGQISDVFAFQDQVTERIVGVIEPSVVKSEIQRSRRKAPENLLAYDLYLRALPHMTSSYMPADAKVAAPLLQEALRLDPSFSAARAQLAHCYEMFFNRNGYLNEDLKLGLEHARIALSAGTDDSNAIATAGFVVWILGQDYETALSALERALKLNPSCTTALIWLAWLYTSGGESIRATECANRALRLSPFDPLVWQIHGALANAAIIDDNYYDAVLNYRLAAQLNPNFSYVHVGYAVALALAGRVDEARSTAQRVFELEPAFVLENALRIIRNTAFASKIVAGARLAGLA